MLQSAPAAPLPFSEAELLDALTGLEEEDPAFAPAEGLQRDVPNEDTNASERATSVDVVLGDSMFSSEQEFEAFMVTLTPEESSEEVEVMDESCVETVPSQSPAGNASAAHSAPMSSKPQAPKIKRKRRKHELDHLRAVAAELEKKLKDLRQSPSLDKPGAYHFWRQVSTQLLTERQKAVRENAKLRELVREQTRAVKSIERSLAKTPDLSKEGFTPRPQHKMTDHRQSLCSSKKLYQNLIHGSSLHTGAGAGARTVDQANAPQPSHEGNRKVNMEMRTDGDCGPRMSLQVIESRIIPFSLELIGDQAWKFLSGMSGHEEFKMSFKKKGNEMHGQCTLISSSGPIQLLGDVAVERYIEANKLTFVWDCDGICLQEEAPLMGVRQKGWCVFEPSQEDPKNTIFRAGVRMTPSLSENASACPDSASSIGMTTERILQNYERTVVYIYDAVLDSMASAAT